jgi:hypothetical protein
VLQGDTMAAAKGLVTAAVNGGDAVERMREVLQVVDTDTPQAAALAELGRMDSISHAGMSTITDDSAGLP